MSKAADTKANRVSSSQRVGAHLRSNLVGYVALFIALSGTAYATHPGGANTISSSDIINGEVFGDDVRVNQINSTDIRDDTLQNGGLAAADIGPDAIRSSELADGAVLESNLGDSVVSSDKLTPFAVQESDIFPLAVTQGKIASGAVIERTIGPSAVSTGKIAFDAVTSQKVAPGAIRAGGLGPINTRSTTGGIAPGENSLLVRCNVNEEALSGGFRDNSHVMDVVASNRVNATSSEGPGWLATFDNPLNEGSLSATVFAYCLAQ